MSETPLIPDFSAQPYVNYEGDALEVISRLDCKIDCVVTSPPYFKQREYGDNERELGQEATPDEFVSSLTGIFIALKPKLNPWASVWVNLGNKRGPKGDLLAIPSRFILAMNTAGFYLVDEVIWAKEIVPVDGKAFGHCMIEPADWRLNANGWEPLYRFVLDPDEAWFDKCAVRIPRDADHFFELPTPKETALRETVLTDFKNKIITEDERDAKLKIIDKEYPPVKIEQHPYEHPMESVTSLEGRRLTNVWHVGSSRKGEGKHFAAYPAALVERPIAMTCPEWIVTKDGVRVPRTRLTRPVEYSEGMGKSKRIFGQYSHVKTAPNEETLTEEQKKELSTYRGKAGRMDTARHYTPQYDQTIGWTDSDLPAEPGIVLDPFSGTGTTGEVALKLGRRYIGIDLYAKCVEGSNLRCYEVLHPEEAARRKQKEKEEKAKKQSEVKAEMVSA
jgi:DNA modification methylase